ncbi:hypothetical protein PFICI_03402 [Pestalotiopsis fici W106-1]|uniref:DNA2/NAM7 helicase helicase domain-containing protein n=1 Tax=Pestalotiopsis fici (strain W106-1 / CGMCC3.15140) TaxID=1229662 RepID=W3XIW6_PESFW|nr:uncharacterized protein PFICI_03402 [Pestalotiopsis fici W106-1]ETS85377.1 hypothetical protein PFICI_03402 [Pestalotiopsis fici W106-1]
MGIDVADPEMKTTEQHNKSPDGNNKSGDHMADLHHAPDTGLEPDWKTIDKNARFGIDRAQTYDVKGERIHERKTHLVCAAVAASEVIDGKLSNRRWLGSYTPQYVKTAGHGPLNPGVRSNIAFTNAEYGYGIFEIENVFRQPGETGYVAPFSKTSLSTKLAAKPVAKPMTGSEFETYCKATGLHEDSTDAYTAVFKITIHITTSGARYVEHRPAILRHTRLNHVGWDTVRQETRQSATEFSGKELLIEMFFPGTGRLPALLFRDLESTIAKSKKNPYERLVTKVSRSRTFKSMRDMPSVLECGFVMPDAPVVAFSGVDEQSVRLGIALRDEYQFEESLMALAEKRPCNTLALRLKGHQVKGVDGGFLFIFVDPPADLVPEIGERFLVRLDNVPFAQPDSPTIALTDAQRCETIATCITETCEVARSLARMDDNLFLGYIYDALDQVVNDDEQRDEFMEFQARKLMPRKGTPATDTEAATPSEHPSDHRTRVRDWVKDKFSHGLLKTPDKILDRCPDMPAVRIVAPSWLEPLEVVVAYVRAPKVPEWPKNIKPTPVIDVKFPRISIQPSVYETVRTARKHMKNLKFTTRFIRRAHDGQMNAGLHALDLAGKDTWELSEAHDATFARLIAKGGGPTIDYNVLEALPLLNEFMAHVKSETVPTDPVLKACLAIYKKLDADQKLIFDDLTALPFGIRIVSGGPGSGKNFVVQLFMAIAQHSEVVEDVVNGWLNTTVPLPAQRTTTNDRSSDGAWVTQQPTLSADDKASWDTARREIKSSKETLDFGDHMSDPDAYSARHQGKLVILAPSNKLLDKIAIDLRDLYAELKLKKRICRVLMPGTASSDMEHRIRSEPPVSPYDEDIPEEGDDIFETDIYLGQLSKECLDQHRFIDPPGGDFAVSALVAKRITNPVHGDGLAEYVTDLEAERSSDPDNFYLTCIKILRGLLKKARNEEYLAADVLLSTPEAWFNLSCQKLPMKITALWIDESFRMTEPEALIGLQHAHQAKVRFMTGDNEQHKPIVKSIDAHKSKDDDRVFCAQFGSQLGLALPSRMMAAGYEHIILNHNHRAQGGVSEFPNE